MDKNRFSAIMKNHVSYYIQFYDAINNFYSINWRYKGFYQKFLCKKITIVSFNAILHCLKLPGLGSRTSAATKPQIKTCLDTLKKILKSGIVIFGSGLDFQLIFKI